VGSGSKFICDEWWGGNFIFIARFVGVIDRDWFRREPATLLDLSRSERKVN